MMEDKLTCAICLDLFNDLVTLPCRHCFCRECMNKTAQSCMTFSCPTCREQVSKKQLRRLPENECLSNTVVAYRREKEMASSVSEMICDSHQTKSLSFFCETCQKPACSECVRVSHKDDDHRISFVEHLIQCKKGRILELMNALEDVKLASEKRKISLSQQKLKLMKEKEAAKKSCSLLIDLLKSQLARMQSEYQQILDRIYVKCDEVEAINESSLTTIHCLQSLFTSLKYKADRHLHFQMLCAFEKQLSSFILSSKTTNPLRLDHMKMPKFVLRNAYALERTIKRTELEAQSVDGGWETYFTKNEEVMNGNSSDRQFHDHAMGNRDSSMEPGFQSAALSSVALSSHSASISGQLSRLQLLPSSSSILASAPSLSTLAGTSVNSSLSHSSSTVHTASSHHCFVPKTFSATGALAGKQMSTTSTTTSSNIVIPSALSRELKKEPISSLVLNRISEDVFESSPPVITSSILTDFFESLRSGTSKSSSSRPFVPMPFPSTSCSSKDNAMESCQLSWSSWGMPANQSTSGASATNSEGSVVPASTGITLPAPVFTIGSSQDGTAPNTKARLKRMRKF